MAQIGWKSQEQIEAEAVAAARAKEIELYEQELDARYKAFNRLLATNAPTDEIEACRSEIQAIIEALGVLYSAA